MTTPPSSEVREEIPMGIPADPLEPQREWYRVSADELAAEPGQLIRYEALDQKSEAALEEASATYRVDPYLDIDSDPAALSLLRTINNAPHELLNRFLRAGWAVAMTDYEGLGTYGVHPYLLGESEGRGILDIVPAVRELAAADDVNGPGIAREYVIVGHSQGGQAALFGAHLAHRDSAVYADRGTLLGVAALAPASNLKGRRSRSRRKTGGCLWPISWVSRSRISRASSRCSPTAVRAARSARRHLPRPGKPGVDRLLDPGRRLQPGQGHRGADPHFPGGGRCPGPGACCSTTRRSNGWWRGPTIRRPIGRRRAGPGEFVHVVWRCGR
jgi:hypothetical protein